MRDITIDRSILHVVRPRARHLVLSDEELNITDDIARFLAGHLRQGLKDPQAQAANFIVPGGQAAQTIGDLLGSNPDFVNLSRQLAQSLHAVTNGDDRISDGTLAISLCGGILPTGNRLPFVAVVKLDPSSQFRTVEQHDRAGRTILGLELENDILPSIREQVQKCAFIRPAYPAPEYQLLVTDRQAAGVARFFMLDFLGAQTILDARERTLRLNRAMRDGRNLVAPDLDASSLQALDQVIFGTLAGASVNLDDLVDALPVPEPARSRIGEILAQALPDREFVLDASVLRKKKVFEGDNGLRLSVPAEFFEQMIRVEDIGEEEPRLRRITFTTRIWQEA